MPLARDFAVQNPSALTARQRTGAFPLSINVQWTVSLFVLFWIRVLTSSTFAAVSLVALLAVLHQALAKLVQYLRALHFHILLFAHAAQGGLFVLMPRSAGLEVLEMM